MRTPAHPSTAPNRTVRERGNGAGVPLNQPLGKEGGTDSGAQTSTRMPPPPSRVGAPHPTPDVWRLGVALGSAVLLTKW